MMVTMRSIMRLSGPPRPPKLPLPGAGPEGLGCPNEAPLLPQATSHLSMMSFQADMSKLLWPGSGQKCITHVPGPRTSIAAKELCNLYTQSYRVVVSRCKLDKIQSIQVLERIIIARTCQSGQATCPLLPQ